MQEEVDSRTVALSISAAKFTGRMFKAAIGKYMAHRKEKKLQKARDGPVKPCGKQTVKQLIGQKSGCVYNESNDPRNQELRENCTEITVLDYAVKKVRTWTANRSMSYSSRQEMLTLLLKLSRNTQERPWRKRKSRRFSKSSGICQRSSKARCLRGRGRNSGGSRDEK